MWHLWTMMMILCELPSLVGQLWIHVDGDSDSVWTHASLVNTCVCDSVWTPVVLCESSSYELQLALHELSSMWTDFCVNSICSCEPIYLWTQNGFVWTNLVDHSYGLSKDYLSHYSWYPYFVWTMVTNISFGLMPSNLYGW